MRSRAEMKMAAKQNYYRYQGVFLAIGAILVVAGIIASIPNNFAQTPSMQQMSEAWLPIKAELGSGSAQLRDFSKLFTAYLDSGSKFSNVVFLQINLLMTLLGLGLSVLQVGLSNAALFAGAGGEAKFALFYKPLKDFGRWLGLYAMMLLRIFLWMLLFIIPGIIASYQYRLAVYLMLEYPELGINKALRLSGQLMEGYKWQLFVLDLSFILWWLLNLITFGLANLYVLPYRELTNVQFYRDLRAEHPVEGLAVVGPDSSVICPPRA